MAKKCRYPYNFCKNTKTKNKINKFKNNILIYLEYTITSEVIVMKNKKEEYVLAKELAWKRFCETGEIGAYMLYKKLSEEKNGNKSSKGNSSPRK